MLEISSACYKACETYPQVKSNQRVYVTMVLDIELFRADKGGDPEKMRKNQRDRFDNPELVETVIREDENWRKLRHLADEWNKLKNLCSKVIGEKMKVRFNWDFFDASVRHLKGLPPHENHFQFVVLLVVMNNSSKFSWISSQVRNNKSYLARIR